MKKLLLLVLLFITLTITSFAQSFIGYSKDGIYQKVGAQISSFEYADNALTLKWLDGHTGFYYFNDDVCVYYFLFFDINTNLEWLVTNLNTETTYLSNLKWYSKMGDYTIYYTIDTSTDKATWIYSVYPDVFEDTIIELKKTL
jgi:hypothetical protein